MPSGWDKFRIFAAAAEEFTGAGYRFVGFDHFARPDDELAKALDEGRVFRNFMGYTVQPAADQIGVGMTSIGDIAGAYVANHKKLSRYMNATRDGRLAVERGLCRDTEDELRRAVIHRIICTLELDFGWIENHLNVDPKIRFASEIESLGPMAEDGLLEIDRSGIRVTDRGRFFLRNICMPFDSYLAKSSDRQVYSRTV